MGINVWLRCMAGIEKDQGDRTCDRRKYRLIIGKHLCRVWSMYNMQTASRDNEAPLANRISTGIEYTVHDAFCLAPVLLQAQMQDGNTLNVTIRSCHVQLVLIRMTSSLSCPHHHPLKPCSTIIPPVTALSTLPSRRCCVHQRQRSIEVSGLREEVTELLEENTHLVRELVEYKTTAEKATEKATVMAEAAFHEQRGRREAEKRVSELAETVVELQCLSTDEHLPVSVSPPQKH